VTNERDREQRNAMAARGYWLAFQSVQKGVGRVLRGDNLGQITDEDDSASSFIWPQDSSSSSNCFFAYLARFFAHPSKGGI